jgi:hypothetical protein
VTAFATNTPRGQLPDLELRDRRCARAEDRIRTAKDTCLTNLPLHHFAQNQIWCAIVTLATELTAWMQMLALHEHEARRREPKRLRYRLLTVPAALARTGRQALLHLAKKAPWSQLVVDAIDRLRALAVPAEAYRLRPKRPRTTPASGSRAPRDDTRATVTRPRQNQNQTAPPALPP